MINPFIFSSGAEVLRLEFEGVDGSTTFTDLTGRHTLNVVGSPTISTAQFFTGTSSANFPATHSILECAGASPVRSNDFIHTGNFKYRLAFRCDSVSSQQIFTNSPSNAGGYSGYTSRFNLTVQSGVLSLRTNSNQAVITTGSIAANTWYDVIIERVGSIVTLYKNGVSVGTYTSSSTWGSGGLFLGINNSASMLGYIGIFVVTQGG